MTKLLRKLQYWLERFTQPTTEELVSFLVSHVAFLELYKGEQMEFAPVKGSCGPFRVSGTCLPVFEYRVFEKSIMEFIHVRVEVSKPDRITFITTIDSTTAPERHGEEVEVKDKYRQPFITLAYHLFRYFPYYKKIVVNSGL